MHEFCAPSKNGVSVPRVISDKVSHFFINWTQAISPLTELEQVLSWMYAIIDTEPRMLIRDCT